MKALNQLFENYNPQPSQFKTRRDEILSEHIDAINAERKEAGYKPITKKYLNIQIE